MKLRPTSINDTGLLLNKRNKIMLAEMVADDRLSLFGLVGEEELEK